jgi:hypothetical protein
LSSFLPHREEVKSSALAQATLAFFFCFLEKNGWPAQQCHYVRWPHAHNQLTSYTSTDSSRVDTQLHLTLSVGFGFVTWFILFFLSCQ